MRNSTKKEQQIQSLLSPLKSADFVLGAENLSMSQLLKKSHILQLNFFFGVTIISPLKNSLT